MVSMGNGIFIPHKIATTGFPPSANGLPSLINNGLQQGLPGQQPFATGNLQTGLLNPMPVGLSANPVINQLFLMANNFSLVGSMLLQFSSMLQTLMQNLASSGLSQIQPQPPAQFYPLPGMLGTPLVVNPQPPAANLLSSIMSQLPNLMALASPQVSPPTYNGGLNSRYWGDPHLIGFDGEKYDVMGQGGNIYNMLSDKNVQYNTRFIHWGAPGKDGVQPTVIGEAGIQVGKNQIYFDRSGKTPTVNGQSMTTGQTIDLGHGNFAQWDGKELIVKTDEYTIDLKVKQPEKNGGYLDSNVTINPGVNPLADGVTPHGLLGQTADGVTGARKGKDGNLNIQKQGGDVIDGVVDDYKVTHLWNNTFKYNRFQAEASDTVTRLLAMLQRWTNDLAA